MLAGRDGDRSFHCPRNVWLVYVRVDREGQVPHVRFSAITRGARDVWSHMPVKLRLEVKSGIRSGRKKMSMGDGIAVGVAWRRASSTQLK